MRLESCITRLQMRLFLGGVQSGTENFLYVSRDVNFLRAQKGSSRGVYIEAPPPPPPRGGGQNRGFRGFPIGGRSRNPHWEGGFVQGTMLRACGGVLGRLIHRGRTLRPSIALLVARRNVW